MGSGHILVYAFDVLIQLYVAEGFRERDAVELILRNNLYGLDIDKRAFQLAYFALMMKARQYSRRILNKHIKLNVYTVPGEAGISESDIKLLPMNFPDQEKAFEDLETLVTNFKYGSDLGSLIEFKDIDFENLKSGLNTENISLFDDDIRKMVCVGELLQQKYDIAVTNPPYMGSSGFNSTLSTFAKKNYKNSKSDLFAMFIERWNHALNFDWYNSMVTMQSWMFLSSYESMRKNIISKLTITNLMHMENMVMGIAFGTAVTIFKKNYLKGFKGTYHQIKFKDISQKDSPKSLPITGNRFNQISQDEFTKIPGQPISYWVSENLIHLFQKETIADYGFAGIGMRTGNNEKFLRRWFEVDAGLFNPNLKNIDSQTNSDKWLPYNKGGEFRRFYGNNEYIVNWQNNGNEIKKETKKKYPQLGDNLGWKISNEKYYLKSGITWTGVSTGKFNARKYPNGFLFDSGANGLFCYDKSKENYILGLLNTKAINWILQLINPTINYGAGTIRKIPVVYNEDFKTKIDEIVNILYSGAHHNWDNYETSWDFKSHPLI